MLEQGCPDLPPGPPWRSAVTAGEERPKRGVRDGRCPSRGTRATRPARCQPTGSPLSRRPLDTRPGMSGRTSVGRVRADSVYAGAELRTVLLGGRWDGWRRLSRARATRARGTPHGPSVAIRDGTGAHSAHRAAQPNLLLRTVVEYFEGGRRSPRVSVPISGGEWGRAGPAYGVPARPYSLVKLGRQAEGPGRENSLASLSNSLRMGAERVRPGR